MDLCLHSTSSFLYHPLYLLPPYGACLRRLQLHLRNLPHNIGRVIWSGVVVHHGCEPNNTEYLLMNPSSILEQMDIRSVCEENRARGPNRSQFYSGTRTRLVFWWFQELYDLQHFRRKTSIILEKDSEMSQR